MNQRTALALGMGMLLLGGGAYWLVTRRAEAEELEPYPELESLYKVGDKLVGDGAEWMVVYAQFVDGEWRYILRGRGGPTQEISTIPPFPGRTLSEPDLTELIEFSNFSVIPAS